MDGSMAERDHLLNRLCLIRVKKLEVLEPRHCDLGSDRLPALATSDRLMLLYKNLFCEQLPGIREQDQRALVPVRVAHSIETVNCQLDSRLCRIKQLEILPTALRRHRRSLKQKRTGHRGLRSPAPGSFD